MKPANAPYFGGSSPGADLFMVDGDFTSCDPCGLPEISYPFKGDSILSRNDIVVFYPESTSGPAYATVSLGTPPNIHPWSPNQAAIIVEQDFIVALSAYRPMSLNTPYNPVWAFGSDEVLALIFPNGIPAAALDLLFLIEEGELKDIGGGLVKVRRKWATLPPTRCEMEQYSATFPGLDTNGSVSRPSFTRNVMSRVQYDYFIYDDLDILGGIALFPDGGQRLDHSTGLYPTGLILPQMQYFADSNVATKYGIFVGTPTDTISDGDRTDPTTATLPSASLYLGWCTGAETGNGQAAELVAESSCFDRWMGNIWVRRTRFVLAQ